MNNTLFSPRRLLMMAALLLLALIAYFSLRKKPVQSPDVLTIQMLSLPKMLNPYLTTSGYTIHVSSRIQQSLAVFDPKTLKLAPVLITQIPVKRNVTEGPYKGMHAYDFEILNEARWENNTPVTAADVEFTFKLIFQRVIPQLEAWRGYYMSVRAFVPDPANPRKFSVYLDKPYILELESLCQMPVLPAYNYDPAGNLKDISLAALLVEKPDSLLLADPRLKAFADDFTNPKYGNDLSLVSGSGPYKATVMNEQLVVLEKKKDWWGDKLADRYPLLAAYPKSIQYRLVREDATLAAMLKTREIDFAYNMSPERFLEWKSDTAVSNYYDFVQGWLPSYNRILINNSQPKLADKRVRQAMAYATNYDDILNRIFKGLGTRSIGPVHPNKPYYLKDLPVYQFDIQKAKALLAEAGWTDTNGNGIVDKDMGDGKRTEMIINMLSTNQVKFIEETSNSIRDSYRQAGIEVTIESVEMGALLPRYIGATYDIGVSAGAVNTGLDDFYQTLHSANLAPHGDNRNPYVHNNLVEFRIQNAELDKVIMDIRVSEDEQARNKLYRRLQEIIHEEVPEIYLFAPNQRYIVAKKLDYVLTPERPGFYEYLFHLK